MGSHRQDATQGDGSPEVEGHRLASNDNETIEREPEVEGHRLAANDNETIERDEG